MKIEYRWHDLKKEQIPGDRSVILFPVITDVGHIFDVFSFNTYTISNPEYARLHALEKGYTHWFPIPVHPDEEKIIEKIKKIYENEHKAEEQFNKGFERAAENIVAELA